MKAPGAILALVLLAASAQASLTSSDKEDLTHALRVIAEGERHEDSLAAGSILRRADYGRADFEEFFRFYFSGDPLTPALANYLRGPTFRAPAARTREALQEALAAVLVEEIASAFEDSPGRLGRNSVTFGHLGSSMQLLGRIAYEGDRLSRSSRADHYDRLTRTVAAHPEVLRKEATIDTRARPGLAALRAHLYKNLRDLKVPFDPAAFVVDLGFSGRYAEIVAQHGVLVLDNNGFDERQLRAIQELLALIPPDLHDTAHISQHVLLGNQEGREVKLKLAGSPGVNVFAVRIQGAKNQFPPDVEPLGIPNFCAALQHELNHVVDASTIRGDRALSRRRDELIARAGNDPKQYLRSMLPRGFFKERPQELFASIANQYFASSGHTLRLGLKRLEQDRTEPLNQFLFFAEIYSQGGGYTLFFEQDADCRYSASAVPVGRDARGRIDRIHWQGTDFVFDLDEGGNVLRRRDAGSRTSRRPAEAPVLPEG